MRPYFIEIPELKFDAKQLLKVLEGRDPNEWIGYIDNNGRRMGYDSFRYSDLYNDYPYAQYLRSRLNVDTGPLRSGFVRFNPHYSIPMHCDEGHKHDSPVRQCAVMFPLIPVTEAAPIRWHNPDGSIAMEHHYATRYPTLINVQLPHSVENNEHVRICWQISIYELTFEEAASNYDAGDFYIKG